MDARKILTNGVFCPVPWTGLMYNFDGRVKNCIRSAGELGNIKDNRIEDILTGTTNLNTQSLMIQDQPGPDCHTCYTLEDNKKRFDIVSDRIFYIRELDKVPFDTYQVGNYDLKTIDVRWSNLCNFACVYCYPEFSSRWARELSVTQDLPTDDQKTAFKNYILDHVSQLKHVYLAGGEPLLMKENLELLNELIEKNPQVNLRINTNLSKVDTKIFDLVCQFENVHWTVSVESLDKEFEYIRYGGNWNEFLENLSTIRDLQHKISFNMLYFLLNYRSLFDCVDFLQGMGFHNNSFIIGALLKPSYLNVRHLPDTVLNSLKQVLEDKIGQSPGYLLEDSYRNIRRYLDTPFTKDLSGSLDKLQELDQRRNLDSKQIFSELYSFKGN